MAVRDALYPKFDRMVEPAVRMGPAMPSPMHIAEGGMAAMEQPPAGVPTICMEVTVGSPWTSLGYMNRKSNIRIHNKTSLI